MKESLCNYFVALYKQFSIAPCSLKLFFNSIQSKQQVLDRLCKADIDAVTVRVQKLWRTEIEKMHPSVANAMSAEMAQKFHAESWYPVVYSLYPEHVAHAKQAIVQSSQPRQKEMSAIQATHALQEILLADATLPQTLMHALNTFAAIAVKCDTRDKSQVHIDMQQRVAIEECEFMTNIVTLVSESTMTWENIMQYETVFRAHAQILWREWILLIKLKYDFAAQFDRLRNKKLAGPGLFESSVLHEQSLRVANVGGQIPVTGLEELMEQGLTAAPVAVLKPASWLSAQDVLMGECDGTAWKFQGVLVEYDEQPRTFTSTNNNSLKRAHPDTVSPSVVMNVACIDRTGPCTIILWDSSCESFQRALQSTVLSSTSNTKWILTIERVRVTDLASNASNGNILTPMRSIHSIVATSAQSTTITLTQTATSPFMQDHVYSAPRAPYCITNFQQARTQFVVPFRATLRGTVFDVVKGEFSRNGVPKTTFALVDSAGAWVHCCALGQRNANSQALVEGTEIVGYNVSGRGRLQAAQQPCIWLFKDAFIVPVGVSSVKKLMKIDLVTP